MDISILIYNTTEDFLQINIDHEIIESRDAIKLVSKNFTKYRTYRHSQLYWNWLRSLCLIWHKGGWEGLQMEPYWASGTIP